MLAKDARRMGEVFTEKGESAFLLMEKEYDALCEEVRRGVCL